MEEILAILEKRKIYGLHDNVYNFIGEDYEFNELMKKIYLLKNDNMSIESSNIKAYRYIRKVSDFNIKDFMNLVKYPKNKDLIKLNMKFNLEYDDLKTDIILSIPISNILESNNLGINMGHFVFDKMLVEGFTQFILVYLNRQKELIAETPKLMSDHFDRILPLDNIYQKESNLTNKRKFFSLYYGQKIVKTIGASDIYYDSVNNETLSNVKEFHYLELKSLHDITLNDLSKLPNRDYGDNSRSYEFVESFLTELEVIGFLTSEESDILRDLGYAVEWHGLSVQRLVEYKWIKIKTNGER